MYVYIGIIHTLYIIYTYGYYCIYIYTLYIGMSVSIGIYI